MTPQDALPKKSAMKMKNPINDKLISKYIDSLSDVKDLLDVSSMLIGLAKYAKTKWFEKHNIIVQLINTQRQEMAEVSADVLAEEQAILDAQDGKAAGNKTVMPEMGEHLMDQVPITQISLLEMDNFKAPIDTNMMSGNAMFATQQTGVVSCPDVPGCVMNGRRCGNYPPGSAPCIGYRKRHNMG